ncbi:hypothetical protein GRX03_03580 [Halovenus sp. WSH3]|uniref:Uncharacterized protein n=1 Tax=Halovenus carboxidivorans TaxID=2692199 RepID=A0A6B0TBW1_9EURY|nr:hypothetical protein [Halovenus carboxidivorans]MXR50689.1 hypothetical protein [Halovenus carboxidivorans]
MGDPSRLALLCGSALILVLIAVVSLSFVANDGDLLNESAEIEVDNQDDTGYTISVYYSHGGSVADVSYTGIVDNRTQQYESTPDVPVGGNVTHIEPTNADLLETVRVGAKQSTVTKFGDWEKSGTFVYVIESSNSSVVHVDATHCGSGTPEYYFEADASGYSLSSWTCNDGLF